MIPSSCSCFRKFLLAFVLLFAAVRLTAEQAAPRAPSRHDQPNATATRVGNYDPLADPKAIVIAGHARFTVLTSRMIRMEWSADGKFEDRASFVFLNRKLPVPEFQQRKQAGELVLKTSALELRYVPDSGGEGKFSSDNLSITFQLNGQPVVWHPGMPDSGNLMGTTRTLDGARGDKTREPIEPGLVSRDGWVVVEDSTRPLFDSADFSFVKGDQSRWPWVLLRPQGDRQDWYFFGYGHLYKQALYDFIQVAGRIPLPPRFAFGAWWSRYWSYSDQELEDLVSGFHQNHIPLDVLVIDMDWHKTFGKSWWNQEKDQSGHTLGWSGYSWNRLLFPDPQQFLKKIHEEGLRTTLNLHPASGVQPWEDAYPEMARAMGIDPATQRYVPFDITSKKFATNYLKLLHHPLEKQGIDFWWLDWQQEPSTRIEGVNPTWWLNYVHFTDQQREGKRPLLFHRWGGLGNHRYQIGFSGDTISVWESLAFQPWFTATAANVGYAYWSHDIGGHMPGAVDPELYTRWVQFGVFSPILRTHTTKNPESERRIWAYPEPYSDIMRLAFRLRYALEPYIYTEARQTYDTGVAFLHPLYYEWPEEESAYTSKGEYVFGRNMLVAPVVKPIEPESQMAKQSVWLPKGEWIEWATGRHISGPTRLDRKFSIQQIPVYVRAGAIIPMQADMERSGQSAVDPLIVNVFPLADGQTSSYSLYEDAGNTSDYTRGEAAWTDLSAAEKAGDLMVEIKPVRGGYRGMVAERGYQIRLPGDWPPSSVRSNGKLLPFAPQKGKPGWRYEGNTLTTIITVPRLPLTQAIHIRVHRSAKLASDRGDLDGFAGAMTRLRESYDTLNRAWPLAWSPDALIDAMETGDRLSYHPQSAELEIAHFHTVLAETLRQIENLETRADSPDMQKIIAAFGADWSSELGQQRMAQYRKIVKLGLLEAKDVTEQKSAD